MFIASLSVRFALPYAVTAFWKSGHARTKVMQLNVTFVKSKGIKFQQFVKIIYKYKAKFCGFVKFRPFIYDFDLMT